MQLPDSAPDVHTIEAVRVSHDGVKRNYEIDYVSDDGTVMFGFQYTPADSLIRFPNQSGMRWSRGDNPASRRQPARDSAVNTGDVSELPEAFAECIISATKEKQPDGAPVSCLSRVEKIDPLAPNIVRFPR